MARKQAKGMTKERRERAAESLALREGGATYEQIGKRLGVSTKRAWEDVQDALKEITREPAEAALKMELRRIDSLWRTAYLQAKNGDLKAMNTALQIMDRRTRLLGLDVPQNSDNSTVEAREAFSALFAAGVREGSQDWTHAETNPLDPPLEGDEEQ